MHIRSGLQVSEDALAALCRRYRVIELSLFGSSARGDAREDSDVDVLVRFEPSTPVGFVWMGQLQGDLSDLFGREVDLVPKDGLKLRIREAVLAEAKVLYAA